MQITRFQHCILVILIISLAGACVKRIPSAHEAQPGQVDQSKLYSSILLANYYKFSDELSSAEEFYKQALPNASESLDAYLQFALFYTELSLNSQTLIQERYFTDLAISVCLEGNIRFPDNSPLRILLSDLYLKNKKKSKAIDQLNYVLATDPSNDEIRLQLARLYLRTSNPSKSLEILQLIDTESDMYLDALEVMAYAYNNLEEYDKSLEYHDKLLELQPDNYKVLFNRCVLYHKLGQIDQAIRFLKEILEQYSPAIDARRYLADLFQEREQYSEAINVLENLTYNSTTQRDAQIDIGRLYILNSEPQKAESWLRETLREDTDNKIALFFLGLALSDMFRWDEAKTIFDTILQDTNAPAAAYDLAAFVTVKVGNLVESLRILEKGILQYPKNSRLYSRLAQIYIDNEYLEKAREVFNRGLDEIPMDRYLTISLAMLLESQGQWTEAIRLARKVLKEYPADPEICNFIGYTLADHASKLDEAEKLISIAVKARPESGAYLDSLGWLYFKKHEYEKALDLLQQALKYLQNDSIVWNHFSQVLIKLKRFEKAKDALNIAIELDPDNFDLAERMSWLRDQLSN